MDTKDILAYSAFIETHQAPVFYQPWFLDAVTDGGAWSYVGYKTDGRLNAVWPYFIKSKYRQTYITQPPLTPYLGPYYSRNSQYAKNATWYSYQKKVLQGLWDQLPSFRLITVHFPPEIKNWLPLKWKNCMQTTRYTYRLDLNASEEQLWSGFTDVQRNAIRKAEGQYDISNQAKDEDLWRLIQETYNRQNVRTPFSKSTFEKIRISSIENSCSDTIIIRRDDKLSGFVFLLRDAKRAYLLVTAKANTESGAVSLAIWQAIKIAKLGGCELFDFEGSMIPGIESFFRSFGGEMTPYHRITYTPNKVSEWALRLMNRL